MDDMPLKTLLYMLDDAPPEGAGGMLLVHLPVAPFAAYGPRAAIPVFAEDRADVPPPPEGELYDLCAVRATKNKVEMLGLIALAARRTEEGGRIIVAQANDTGAQGLEAQIRSAFADVEVVSKNKCRGLTIRRGSADHLAMLDEWAAAAAPHMVQATGFVSQPGLFGWDKIDAGSAMLARLLPELTGRVADFGCGYGYLTIEVLKRNPSVKMVAVDHDRRAVANCALNVEDQGVADRAEIVWGDLSRPWNHGAGKYDAVVMNPPFHSGKATDIDLGRRFIENAFENLKAGGTLYMVANKMLPYEAVLGRLFGGSTIIAQEAGFKVISAVKNVVKTTEKPARKDAAKPDGKAGRRQA